MTTPYRNVMIMIADDWSPIAACYGNDVIQTPNIDRFAESATVFDRAFCVSPSCAVSRASLLSGLYPHQHGQYGHTQGKHHFTAFDDVESIPRVLGPRGYATANIGKVHFAPPRVFCFDIAGAASSGSPRDMAAAGSKFIADAGEQPFFLMMASGYPHRGGDASGWNLGHHQDEFATDVEYDPADVVVPAWLPDHPETRRDLAGYYSAVSRFDAFVGASLEMLEASGRADQTLVILTSDHGMPFTGAKASSFDSGHRCPLLIHRPGQSSTVHSNALVNWLDITATVYDWVGIDQADRPHVEGRSLLPILDEAAPAGWDRTYFSHCFHEVTNYFPYRVIREDRYKYIRHLAWQLPQPLPTDLFRSPTWQAVLSDELETMGVRETAHFLHRDREELYDLEADPHETTNRIDDPALADVAERLRRECLDWRQRTDDLWLEVDYQEQVAGAPDGGP